MFTLWLYSVLKERIEIEQICAEQFLMLSFFADDFDNDSGNYSRKWHLFRASLWPRIFDPTARPHVSWGCLVAMNAGDSAITERRTRINRPDDGSARCRGSRVRDQPDDFCPSTPPPSTSSATSSPEDAPGIPSLGHANVAEQGASTVDFSQSKFNAAVIAQSDLVVSRLWKWPRRFVLAKM
jgi:hypothetical protein